MAHFPQVCDNDFDARVLKAERPVLVEFTNDGCGLCKILAPALDDLASEYEGEFDLLEIDTEASPKMTAAYSVQSVPQLLMFSGGEMKERLIGLQTRGRLAEMVEAQTGGSV